MIDIVDKKDCCGCTACASVCGVHAISMKADEEGFLYPEVDRGKCVDCTMCEKVCPIICRDAEDCSNTPLKVYALHNADVDVWRESSSGGVFAALCTHVIKKGGIVYGAEYDDDLMVVHRGEDTEAGVLKFRGSKYVQTDIRGVFKEIRQQLNSSRDVLFSGTPCQVEGLKRFLRKPYPNLLTVDVVCHGVPSPLVFADYVKFINRHSVGRVRRINMKDKSFGWGYQNLRLFFSAGRTEFNSPVSNVWNKIFYDHVANRPSCHDCRFTNYHRAGDLTIGDFWGIEKSHPELLSENGVSLLLINNDKGLSAWNDVAVKFEYVESSVEKCRQAALSHPQPEAADRKDFWREYAKKGFEYAVRKRYGITCITLLKNRLRQLLGIVKLQWKRNQ